MSSFAVDPVVNPDADGLVGGVTLWPSDALPSSKYMFAEGQAISRDVHSLLFSRLGELHGNGDGSTTFNLPDYQGKVMVGLDSSDVDFDTVGATGGTKAATMPTHSHSISPNPHSHNYEESNTLLTGWASGSGGSHWTYTTTATTGTSLTIGDAGGSGDNMPPYTTVRYIIKVL